MKRYFICTLVVVSVIALYAALLHCVFLYGITGILWATLAFYGWHFCAENGKKKPADIWKELGQ